MESLVTLPDGGSRRPTRATSTAAACPASRRCLRIARDGRRHRRDAAAGAFHDRRRPIASRGVRHNLGLESLTRTPDGRLMSGLEQPLVAGRPGVERHASAGASGCWSSCPSRRHLDAGPRVGLRPRPDAAAGWLRRAVPGRRERPERALRARRHAADRPGARLPARRDGRAPAFNPVRLHLVDLDGADDVSALPSLAGVTAAPGAQAAAARPDHADRCGCRRRCARWSNFEGIAAGPPAPDGSPTLIAGQRRQLPRQPDLRVRLAQAATLRLAWACHERPRGSGALVALQVSATVQLVADAAHGQDQRRPRRVLAPGSAAAGR